MKWFFLIVVLGITTNRNLWADNCPPGQTQLICNSVPQCVTSGSTCCTGYGVCSPGFACGLCNSVPQCVQRGSTCCSSAGWCRPGTLCKTCNSLPSCVPPSGSCSTALQSFSTVDLSCPLSFLVRHSYFYCCKSSIKGRYNGNMAEWQLHLPCGSNRRFSNQR